MEVAVLPMGAAVARQATTWREIGLEQRHGLDFGRRKQREEKSMRRLLMSFLSALALTFAAGAAKAADGGTFRSAMRTGCIEMGTLHTTCGHRLDETVLQGLVHIKWTG